MFPMSTFQKLRNQIQVLHIYVWKLALEVDAMRLISDNHPKITSFPSTPSLDEKPSLKKDESSTKDTASGNHASFRGTLQPGSVWVLIWIIIVFYFILEVLIWLWWVVVFG